MSLRSYCSEVKIMHGVFIPVLQQEGTDKSPVSVHGPDPGPLNKPLSQFVCFQDHGQRPPCSLLLSKNKKKMGQ